MIFESEEEALKYGIWLSGYKVSQEIEKIFRCLPEPTKKHIFSPIEKDLKMYEWANPDGDWLEVGIGKSEKGFDIWEISSLLIRQI